MTNLQVPTLLTLLRSNGDNHINSIDIAQDKYIYVAGYMEGEMAGQMPIGGGDGFLAKYDLNGKLIWFQVIGASGVDQTMDLSVAADGSVFVSGYTSTSLYGVGSRGSQDAFVLKYSADGKRLWTKLIGTESSDSAGIVEVDKNGNVYVGGDIGDGSFGFISSYNSNGDLNWYMEVVYKKDNPPNYGGARIRDIKSVADGSIYVTGSVSGELFGVNAIGQGDPFLIKLNSNGTRSWTRIFGSTEYDSAKGVAIGEDGSVYVVGNTRGSVGGQENLGSDDVFLYKFNSNGNLMWTRQAGSSGYDYAKDITIDSAGNIYITGVTSSNYFHGVENKAEFESGFLMGYTPTGEITYVNLIAGEPSDDSYTYGNAIVKFSNGLIIGGDTSSKSFFGQIGLPNPGEMYNGFLLKVLDASIENSQELTVYSVVTSTGSSALYQLTNKKYAIDMAGHKPGGTLLDPLILNIGLKAFSKFKGVVKSLLDYADGSYGLISVSGTSWTEQKFTSNGLALGKGVKLTTAQLLSKETNSQQDINGDGAIGEVVSAALDADGDATHSTQGLYKTLAGNVVLGTADLQAGALLGECIALMSSAKKGWVIPKGASVAGIAFTDGGSLEVLTLKGATYSAQKFDDVTGSMIGKTVKLKPAQVEAREYYYDLDLTGDGLVRLVGQEPPPAGWLV